MGFCLLTSSYLTTRKVAPIPTSSNSAHMLHTRPSPESRTQLNQSLAHSLAYNDSVRPNEVNGEFYWTFTGLLYANTPEPGGLLAPRWSPRR